MDTYSRPYAVVYRKDGTKITAWRGPAGKFVVCSQRAHDLVPVVLVRQVPLRLLASRMAALGSAPASTIHHLRC